jgi:hypothetical protein
MGGSNRVNAFYGSTGLSFYYPENRLKNDPSDSSESSRFVREAPFDPKDLVCSSYSGPLCWNLFSETPPSLAQEIQGKFFRREEELQSSPEFLRFFRPNLPHPLTEANLNLLLQIQPEIGPYFRNMNLRNDPSYEFSIQAAGTMKTPEGFEFPLTKLTVFRKAENGEEIISSGKGGPGDLKPTETPPSKTRGVQLSLLFIGGTLLSLVAMDRLGVPEHLQGPLMLGAFVGIPTAAQIGLSQFKMAEPLSWKGFGANVNGIATSWSYFAPFQVGASFFLDKTGIAEFGTKGNTYGGMLLGASPFVAAKFFPKLRPFVGMGEVAAVSKVGTETALAARGLGIVSNGFRRFIPIAGGVLMADTFAGWGMDLGEWMTGQDKDNYRSLYKFGMELMMAKDFGSTSTSLIGRWMRLWGEVGFTIGKVVDHCKGRDESDPAEKLASQFIQDSNQWGQSMREVLIQLSFENRKEGMLDPAFGSSVRDLYEGPHGSAIQNAYFLLSKTGYAAPEAQKIKDLIHSDGSFDSNEMNQYLKEAIGDEAKKNFQKFMDERLSQFLVQSFRTGPKGNSIDWAAFQRKVMDLYDGHPETFRGIYLTQKGKTEGRELRGMITKDGEIRDISAMEKYLKELLKKRK